MYMCGSRPLCTDELVMYRTRTYHFGNRNFNLALYVVKQYLLTKFIKKLNLLQDDCCFKYFAVITLLCLLSDQNNQLTSSHVLFTFLNARWR